MGQAAAAARRPLELHMHARRSRALTPCYFAIHVAADQVWEGLASSGWKGVVVAAGRAGGKCRESRAVRVVGEGLRSIDKTKWTV